MKKVGSSRFISIVTLILAIGIVFYIRNVRSYLDDLENCSCAPIKYAENISLYESILLIAQYILIFCSVGNMAVPSIFNKSFISNYIWVLYSIVMLTVYFLFLYNVYEFHNGIKDDCDCVNKTQKNMLYAQAIYYGFIIAFIMILMIPIIYF